MTLLEYLVSLAPEGVFQQRNGVLSIDTTDFLNGWDPKVPIEQQRKRERDILADLKLAGKIELVQSALEAVTDVESTWTMKRGTARRTQRSTSRNTIRTGSC